MTDQPKDYAPDDPPVSEPFGAWDLIAAIVLLLVWCACVMLPSPF